MIEFITIINLTKLFFVPDPGKLCTLPYPKHKQGCPNYGKSKNCPPQTKLLQTEYDLKNKNYFCVLKFDFKKHKEKMLRKHPNWTQKQAGCCLYWQGAVRKRLREECQLFCKNRLPVSYDYELIPEAKGLDVFKTAQYHKIYLERNPVNYIYKIAFIGRKYK